jgi:hypothetical protein
MPTSQRRSRLRLVWRGWGKCCRCNKNPADPEYLLPMDYYPPPGCSLPGDEVDQGATLREYGEDIPRTGLLLGVLCRECYHADVILREGIRFFIKWTADGAYRRIRYTTAIRFPFPPRRDGVPWQGWDVQPPGATAQLEAEIARSRLSPLSQQSIWIRESSTHKFESTVPRVKECSSRTDSS